MEEKDWIKVKLTCPRCNRKVVGLQRKDGSVKINCPHCHTIIFSKKKKNIISITTFEN